MTRDELVTRMMDANFKASRTPYTYPPNMVEGMSAALDVAKEELLRPVNNSFYENPEWDIYMGYSGHIEGFNAVLANRRAQLDKVKTAEERVTVFNNDKHLGKDHNALWVVQRDGDNVIHLDKRLYSKEDAEIYRLGLIQKLKEEEKGK